MSEWHVYDGELTKADFRFLAEEVEAGTMHPEHLRTLLRVDADFRNAALANEAVFVKTTTPAETLLRVSPALYFGVLLRRARHDLAQVTHTWERSGGDAVPVFDSGEVGGFLEQRAAVDYLAAMLGSFTRVESYVRPVRVRRGVWRRVRFSDMDVDSLAQLAAEADEPQRFRYIKRIADVCLFVLGIFPGAAATGGQRGRRRGRRTAEEYAEMGRAHYTLVTEHPAAHLSGLAEPAALVRDNFAVARKALNFVADRYLRYARGRVFDMPQP